MHVISPAELGTYLNGGAVAAPVRKLFMFEEQDPFDKGRTRTYEQNRTVGTLFRSKPLEATLVGIFQEEYPLDYNSGKAFCYRVVWASP